jgi:outer membrane lipoprotein-sorting protein
MRRLWIVGLLAIGMLSHLGPGDAVAADASAGELFRLLDAADKRYAQIHDYTAVMVSRERVKDVLQEQERVLLKFQRAFKVYMRWMEGPSQGREGLYVSGAHDGKFLVYEPRGFQRLFTAALDPTDARVMDKSRHPVTDVGIGRLLEIVGDNTRRAARNGVLRVVDRGPGEVAGRRVRQVEGILPRDPQAGYYAYRVQLSFDDEYRVPIRVVVYDWSDQLVEDYTYTNLRLNPGLSILDFDPSNKEYGFSTWRIQVPG